MALVPSLAVRVGFRLEPIRGPMARWQSQRWVLVAVEPLRPWDEGDGEPGGGLRLRRDGAGGLRWFEGLEVGLFRDDAEGLYLNASTPRPCFWVLWRLRDDADEEGSGGPVPLQVTLSYHEAGRWLDAQERVDRVDAPPDVVEWLREFVAAHHRPEPKQRQRPQSFQPLQDRFGRPARVRGADGSPRRSPGATAGGTGTRGDGDER